MTDAIMATEGGAIRHVGDAEYQRVVLFDAPPERVFEALTTVGGIAGWWAPTTGTGLAGGELRLVFSGAARIEGLILDKDLLTIHVDTARRPSTVTWTVRECGFLPDWVGTTPRFELTPYGNGGCRLLFRHQGLTPQLECYSTCTVGWDHHLASLHEYVETGHGHPFGSTE